MPSAISAALDTLTDLFPELASRALSTTITIRDPADPSIQRPPLLTEMDALEMSVCLVENTTYTYITAWTFGAGTWAVGAELLKNVDIKNVGRGFYNQTTGRLIVTLHAGDNPCVGTGTTPGMKEIHEIIITARYNINGDQDPKRIRFRVENLNKVPREP